MGGGYVVTARGWRLSGGRGRTRVFSDQTPTGVRSDRMESNTKEARTMAARKPPAGPGKGHGARSKLNEEQAGKLARALKPIQKGKPEDVQTNMARYAGKWGRWQLGVRGSGPHPHGLDEPMREAIQKATRRALGLGAK
jgi:hypothetical protein